jgi:hypothetical protein
MFIAWVVLLLLYLVCIISPEAILPIANVVSGLVPSIRALRMNSGELGRLPSLYFGISTAALPMLVVFLAWKEDFRRRFEYGKKRSHRPVGELYFIAYALFLPMIALFVWLGYEAPFEPIRDPKLFGERVFYFMIHSPLGPPVMGSTFMLAVVIGLTFSLWLLCLPFSRSEANFK